MRFYRMTSFIKTAALMLAGSALAACDPTLWPDLGSLTAADSGDARGSSADDTGAPETGAGEPSSTSASTPSPRDPRRERT